MIRIRRSEERGQTRLEWLDSRHTFSFGRYIDRAHVGFRTLRVINEDWIAPGKGFGMHPHQDMEIITYVLSGQLRHEDSMGHAEVIEPGMMQRMTAGKGITHSEWNPSPSDPVHLLQIWIEPSEKGLDPSYGQARIKVDSGTRLLAVSPPGGDGVLTMNQDCWLWVEKLEPGKESQWLKAGEKSYWLQLIAGNLGCGDQTILPGDALAVSGQDLKLQASAEPAWFMVFEFKDVR